MHLDTGKYNKRKSRYHKLVSNLYDTYGKGVTLPPEYASFVDKDMLRLLIRLSRYKYVARLLKPTDTVLEVGCGSGLGAIFLSQYATSVTGIDVKSTEIAEAQKLSRRPNTEFKVQDLFEMDNRTRFDVVVALDVIEHFPVREGKKLIAAMKNQINSDGMMVLGTPSIYSYPYQGALSRASHVKCYDKDELEKLVGQYFGRTVSMGMNDETIHSGHPKMTWYYFMLAMYPKKIMLHDKKNNALS